MIIFCNANVSHLVSPGWPSPNALYLSRWHFHLRRNAPVRGSRKRGSRSLNFRDRWEVHASISESSWNWFRATSWYVRGRQRINERVPVSEGLSGSPCTAARINKYSAVWLIDATQEHRVTRHSSVHFNCRPMSRVSHASGQMDFATCIKTVFKKEKLFLFYTYCYYNYCCFILYVIYFCFIVLFFITAAVVVDRLNTIFLYFLSYSHTCIYT